MGGFGRERRIVAVRVANEGDVANAARTLGVHPKYLYQLLRELDLELPPPSSRKKSLTPSVRTGKKT